MTARRSTCSELGGTVRTGLGGTVRTGRVLACRSAARRALFTVFAVLPAGGRPPARKSQSKSQRGQVSGDTQLRQATVKPGQVPTERHWATPSDARNVTGGQGVAGSNPAVPTGNRSFSNIITSHKSQQKSHLVVQWPCPATGRCHCWGRLARRSARLWPACGRRAWRRRA